MIYVKTAMETMPETCMECEIGRRHVEFISCPLLNQVFNFPDKRPVVCPLIEVHTESLPAPSNTEPSKLANTRCLAMTPEHGKLLTWNELEEMDGEPVWVVQKKPVWSEWMLIDLNGGVARQGSYYVYLAAQDAAWIAYRIALSPTRTLSRNNLLEMNKKPVFITCRPDAAGEQCKFWALVIIENGEIRLQNSLGGCSSYEEVEDMIETITAM